MTRKLRCTIIGDNEVKQNMLLKVISKSVFIDEVDFNLRENLNRNILSNYDIAFINISMLDNDGVELFELIKRKGNHLVVVYVASEAEEAMEALGLGARYHILRPVNEKVIDCILMEASKGPKVERIGIKTPGEIVQVKIDEIVCIESQGKKSKIVTKSKVVESSVSIGTFIKLLPQHLFLRCHKSFIINISNLESLSPLFKGSYVAKMSNGSTVDVSRNYYNQLKNRLMIL